MQREVKALRADVKKMHNMHDKATQYNVLGNELRQLGRAAEALRVHRRERTLARKRADDLGNLPYCCSFESAQLLKWVRCRNRH